MLEIKKIVVGELESNCYLAIENDLCLIIDPGANPEKIIKQITKLNLKPIGIVLTHCHYDHISAVPKLQKKYPDIEIFAHTIEIPLLADPESNFSDMFEKGISITANHPLKNDEIIKLEDIELKVIHTPGHTPGGICLYTSGILFSGDTMFKEGWGRTDLPGGNEEDLFDSLNLLITLPGDTKVYPGHGDNTVISVEKQWLFNIM